MLQVVNARLPFQRKLGVLGTRSWDTHPRALPLSMPPAATPFSPTQGISQETSGSGNKGSLKLRINLAKPKREKEKLQKQKSGGITPGTAAGSPRYSFGAGEV